MDLKIILAIIIFTAGLSVILYVFYLFLFYNISIKKWKKIEGKIIESSVEYFRSKTDTDTEGWRHKIIYVYIVDSVEYKSDKITKNIRILLPFESSLMKIRYYEGQKITVYVNKNNSNDSIIDSSFDYTNLIYVIVGIIAMLVSNFVLNE